METKVEEVSVEDVRRDLRQQVREASDDDIAQAASFGVIVAQSQAGFAAAAPTGFAANYHACDAAAKAGRDAAIAKAMLIPNPILRLGAIAVANALYRQAQAVCHKKFPNG